MANGYWLVQTDITDPEQHAKYVKKNRPVFARYGARILVRWGQHQVVEGTARSRQVVFEFPDYESAVACFDDPEYEAAQQLRRCRRGRCRDRRGLRRVSARRRRAASAS